MTLADMLVPTYVQMLKALSAWLDKAQAQMPGEAADGLLSARLAPDMFPLGTQVRFCCVQALEGVYRLQGEDFPPAVQAMLDEGRHAGEAPGTLAQAQERIAQTIAMVEAVPAKAMAEDAQAPLAHALPNGMILDLTAGTFVRDWALSQFYFHLMAAYAILRAQGVALGKADYVAHLFPHIRPGTMPQQPA
jgi:hypothetical protein